MSEYHLRLRNFVATILVIAGLVGCATTPSSDAETAATSTARLFIPHQAGGTARAVAMWNGQWIEAHGNVIRVIDRDSLRPTEIVSLGSTGRAAPVTDLAVVRDSLFALQHETAIVELELVDGDAPKVVRRRSASELGIKPTALHITSGNFPGAAESLYATGRGGVVRLPDGERVYECDGSTTSVVQSGRGLVTCVGRRIYNVDTGDYIGSASSLTMIPRSMAGQLGGFVFTRARDGITDIGLMARDLRERNALEGIAEIPGTVHRIRCMDDNVWVLSEDRLYCYRIAVDRLRRLFSVERDGIEDLAALDRNRLALAGERGRAVMRPLPEQRGERPGVWLNQHPSRSGLTDARSDGRFIIVRNAMGTWQYDPLRGFEPAEWPSGGSVPPARVAATIHAEAELVEGTDRCIIRPRGANDDPIEIQLDGSLASTVVAIRGRFWIGHERGIAIIDPMTGATVDALLLDGPVFMIHPTLDGRGALWASRHGGVGVARWSE